MGLRDNNLYSTKHNYKDTIRAPEKSEVNDLTLTLVQNVRDGVVIVQDGAYQFANDGIAEFSGYTSEEIVGMRALHLIAPESRGIVLQAHERRMAGETMPAFYEGKIRCKDGLFKDVELSAGVIQYKERPALIIIMRDITERKQSERIIRNKLEFETIVSAVSSRFVRPRNFIQAVNQSIIDIGRLIDADRAYLFLSNEGGDSLDKTNNLKEIIITEQISDFHYLHSKIYMFIKKELEAGQPIYYLDITQMPSKAKLIAELMQHYYISSFLLMPLYVHGDPIGYMGFDNFNGSTGWSHNNFAILRTSSEIIGQAFERRQADNLINRLIKDSLDAQEREREQICFDVHDGLTQTLSAASNFLHAIDKESIVDRQAKISFNKAIKLINKAINECREVINSLQPASLKRFGLAATLEQEFKHLQKENDWQIEYDINSARLPIEVETGLYRIIQEAITNIKKHAETKKLRVTMKLAEKIVRLEVKDWGIGFYPLTLENSTRRCSGLIIMQKRAEFLRGTCKINSYPGEGTTIQVEIPINDTK